MKRNISAKTVFSALIVMAIVSLLAMIGLLQIDHIVHDVLYDFGLRFSYQWATPYWVNSAIIIGLSWFNIIASIVLVCHLLRGKRRSMGVRTVFLEKITIDDKQQHKMNEYLKPQLVEAMEKTEAPVQGTDVSPAEGFVKPAEEPSKTYTQEHVSTGHQESHRERSEATTVVVDETEE